MSWVKSSHTSSAMNQLVRHARAILEGVREEWSGGGYPSYAKITCNMYIKHIHTEIFKIRWNLGEER